MTKEPIIIDDVDVSECEYLNKDFCNCVGHLLGEYDRKPLAQGIYCENNPNCYYKQLKRSEAQCEAMFVSHTDLEKKYKTKEQECEELKKNYFTVIQQRNIAEQQLDQLKQENKELKEKVNSYICSTNCYKHKENDKYRQALQEIKEIITNSFDSCYVCNSKDSCEKCLQGEILQKCEVLDGR